ncbi:MAG: lactate permease [Hyphomicrobiaceae bacterium]|jgi:lactate permease
MLLVWLSPIILFLILSATRYVPAMTAALLALTLSAFVVVGVGPLAVTPLQFLSIFVAGAWIAVPAVAVILAGLYFTEVLATAATRSDVPDAASTVSARELGTTCLFLGPFIETATGFGVGYVVAVSGVMRAGIGPAGALALAAFSQCLVPWGALGVGTKISAAIIAMPLEDITWRIAIVVAPVLWLMVVFYWQIARAAGVEFSVAQKIEDLLCVTTLSLLLIATSKMLPIELAGLTAIGPVLLFRIWRREGRQLLTTMALRRATPYLLLILLLGLTKLAPDVRSYLSAPAFTPGQGAPLFAPLSSPAIALVLASILGCLAHGHWSGLSDGIGRAVSKGMRACIMTILLVALAWIVVRSGIAEAFANAIRESFGDFAALIVPMLGALGGYLTGSNTGAGSLAMPVAASLTSNAGLLAWIAAASIMAGSIFTAFSPVRFAMGQAISGANNHDAGKALRSLIPFALVTVGTAVLTAFLAGLWVS